MGHKILVSPERLMRMIENGQCIVVDCRFDLGDPSKGEQDYLAGHIPGAHYAHLDRDLSSAITARSGRHPLPKPQDFASFLAGIGWNPDTLLVVYDENTNAFAVRLWWLMRAFGLPAAVLDGGLAAWRSAGLPLQPGPVEVSPSARPPLELDEQFMVSADEVSQLISDQSRVLLDARAPERFSGEVEPLDSAAGHIPGALNRPLGLNLDKSGRFKSAGDLKTEFMELLPSPEKRPVVHYCGSGVTACHNYFAMTLAGLNPGQVFPGSWSEWIRDHSRPIEKGL